MITKYFGRLRQKYITGPIHPLLVNIGHRICSIKASEIPFGFNVVEIETSTICNRKCTYCPNSKYSLGEHYISYETLKLLLDQLSDIKYRGIITPQRFNEPLMDNRITDICRLIKKKLIHCNIVLTTNGDLLTEEKSIELIDAGVELIRVSLHDNQHKERILNLQSKLALRYRRKIEIRLFSDSMWLHDRAGLVDVKKPLRLKFCYSPYNYLIINYRGEIVLCHNDYFSEVILGNVHKQNVSEIWLNSKNSLNRSNIAKGNYPFNICKKCAGIN